MPVTTRGLMRLAAKVTAVGIGAAAAAATYLSVAVASANAEVIEVSPRPNVSSRQAVVVDQNALRRAGQGVTRGAGADNRRAGPGGVMAQGEVRDSVIAVPGTSSAPFRVAANGEFRKYAPMGSW